MGPAILPALLVCFIAGKAADRKVLRRQLSIALLVFAMVFGLSRNLTGKPQVCCETDLPLAPQRRRAATIDSALSL